MRGDSLSIVIEHLLEGWMQLTHDDEIHLVVGPDPRVIIPEQVIVHSIPFRRLGVASRLWAQSRVVPQLCRELKADIMFGVLPTTTVSRLPCPRVVMVADLRHKILPEGFTRKGRLFRTLSYSVGYRQSDGAWCISGRSRDDLVRYYPKMARRPLAVALLGADHVDQWPRRHEAEPYAIAFGHYPNKNVDLVIDAWALRAQRGETALPLQLVGLPSADRPRVQAQVEALGLGAFVTIRPWLPDEEFRQTFASAGLVVFPSDFEGFGLPAVEAMRLGIPVVISPDPALLEVSGGHAAVMAGDGPDALVAAVEQARNFTPEHLAGARDHATHFTWSNCARSVRGLMVETVARRRGTRPTPSATNLAHQD